MTSAYEFEDLRTFFMRRQWLHDDDGRDQTGRVISASEYEHLKRRHPIAVDRAGYLRAFIDGYRCARE